MRVLATFSEEALGARYADGAGIAVSPDGHLAIPVSTPGGASEYRVVDLRDPSAPPRAPDAEAMFATWGPDDRLAMVVNSGDLTIYDAHTGLTSAVAPHGGAPRDILFRPAWALDGSGLQANGSEGPGFGVLGLDGTFIAGATPCSRRGSGPPHGRDRRTSPVLGGRGLRLRGRLHADDDGRQRLP